VTGGVVAYLQRTDPSLLKLTAPNARDVEEGVQDVAQRGGWRTTQKLWIGLALLMILSPLGLLAAGTAWGEWAPEDFVTAEGRQIIATGSGGQLPPTGPGSGGVLPPGGPPSGLAELSSVWTAPIPDYAPPWMQSETFGYILSALVGGGLIIMMFFLISWIARVLRREPEAPASRAGPGTV
jgi:cobalt/nickel transport system permease protein